eukprot:2380668-Rhodomonas_salina.5
MTTLRRFTGFDHPFTPEKARPYPKGVTDNDTVAVPLTGVLTHMAVGLFSGLKRGLVPGYPVPGTRGHSATASSSSSAS